EFAITTSMMIAVSAVVALTLTPMMAARLVKSPKGARHGRLYRWSERAFDAIDRAYERSLDMAIGHRRITLAIFVATIAATVSLFVAMPKGFFPQQDTGLLVGISEAAQDVSFAEMVRRQEALLAVIN
ncbi:efflux RND transporter permease subunit, partial [Burkholderia cenocepacia]|uniref:efflux RND transporter permease subunit n=1 Tax=Burkholderia cenocepacia TaxID=95486 RepID=UPI0038CC1783